VIVSTHDLELALRTADVVWLLVPGGDVVTGAPEDVVISGAIAQAFEGRQIRFQPEALSFRWLTGDRGTAVVHGDGLAGVMGRAVLEREGFAISADAPAITVAVTERGWQVRAANGRETRGETFRSLAIELRRQGDLFHAS
jgi:iron complex transport system ATP-binding protein